MTNKHVFLLLSLIVVCFTTGKSQAGASDTMQDKFEISELINNWALYRDQGDWDALAAVFHGDGAISLSWFDGPHRQFVAASKQLSARPGAIVKHHLGVPSIRVKGIKAVSEVNVTIRVRSRTDVGEVDTTSYARFYDRIEKRAGTWKLLKRVAIYEFDRADPADGHALPEATFKELERYPAELKFLASSLDKQGIELSKSVVRDKSPALAELYKSGDAWLAAK